MKANKLHKQYKIRFKDIKKKIRKNAKRGETHITVWIPLHSPKRLNIIQKLMNDNFGIYSDTDMRIGSFAIFWGRKHFHPKSNDKIGKMFDIIFGV